MSRTLTVRSPQVQNILYRVHKYQLGSKSGLFKDMLSIKPADRLEGKTDATPIYISEVAESFDVLLWYFYSTYVAQ